MAARLVDAPARRLRPDEYEDEYREAVLRSIEARRKGKEIVPEDEPSPRRRRPDGRARGQPEGEAA